MADYIVTWVIDIFDAKSPKEAAQRAWEHMRRPDSIATVFEVREKLLPPAIPPTITVDLQDEEGGPTNGHV